MDRNFLLVLDRAFFLFYDEITLAKKSRSCYNETIVLTKQLKLYEE